MVNILLPTRLIAAGRLDMSAGIGADPDVAPRRRDDEIVDALARVIVDERSISGAVREASPMPPTADPRVGIRDIFQPRRARKAARIVKRYFIHDLTHATSPSTPACSILITQSPRHKPRRSDLIPPQPALRSGAAFVP